MDQYEWKDEPPENDGDFFYTGETPDGEDVVAIVQITTTKQGRMGWLFIPANWRKDKGRENPVLKAAELSAWKGQWAGPEYGLCCAVQ